ncbi:MAG TPA: cytochrome c oxidase assembly protein [Steroidobacteraceae bacterium]
MSSLVMDLRYLLPWQFSPTIFILSAAALTLYLRGLGVLRRSGGRVGFWRAFTFLLGLALNYAMLQTYVDYLSAHMFWIHRFQHLVLHHIGPVLMVLAGPDRVLRAGIPASLRRVRIAAWIRLPLQFLFSFVQHPLVAPVLFIGVIFFWLTPSIHFTAMIDTQRFTLMNWSMLADGLLFWWLMLAPRQVQGHAAIGYGTRLVILALIAIPQLILGAYITLHSTPLYDIYSICGRAWAVDPLYDQQIGGLLTWIPAAMMSLVGIIVVLHHILHDPESTAVRPRRHLGPPAQPVGSA